MLMAGCYGYTLYFFQSWFPTFLVKGRGFTEAGLLLSSLPFFVGACANGCGGFISDALVRKLGLKWGRRSLGVAGLVGAALFMVAAMISHQKMLSHEKMWSVIFLSLSYGGITLQQPGVLGICLDIGGKFSGAVTGAMNMATFVAAFLSSVAYGYIAKSFGYDAPFIPMIVLLVAGALMWFKIDATEDVIPEKEALGEVALQS